MGAVFDPTGKEWINISGSSVAVTNSFSVSGSSVAVTNSLNVNGSTVSATNTLTVGTIPIVITGNGASVQVTNQPTVTIPNTTSVSATNSLTVGTMPIIVTGNGASVQITNTPSVTLPNTTTVSATNQLTLVNTTAVSATNSLTIGTLPALAAGSAQIGTVNGSTISITNTLTEASASAILSALQSLTNNAAPYTVPFVWNSGATIGSNILSSSACTIGYMLVLNTNNAPVQLSLYNVASGTTLGSTNNLIFSGPIPAGFTNSAGFSVGVTGVRCSSGLTAVVTGAGNTNGNPAGALWINGALKP